MPVILPLRSETGQVQSNKMVWRPTRTPLLSNRGASGPTRRAMVGAVEAKDAHRKQRETCRSYKEGYLLRTMARLRRRRCRGTSGASAAAIAAFICNTEGRVGGASSSAGAPQGDNCTIVRQSYQPPRAQGIAAYEGCLAACLGSLFEGQCDGSRDRAARPSPMTAATKAVSSSIMQMVQKCVHM